MEDNLILIGFMGAGKTTVGERLAARLSRRFVDIDAVVEARAGMSVSDIFEREGEKGFRRREADAIATVCDERGLVIATGGGSVMQRDSLARLREAGTLVWLQDDLDRLLARAAAERQQRRPLLQRPRAAIERLYEVRRRVYGLADYIIDVDGQWPDDVAAVIERIVRGVDCAPKTTVPVRLAERGYDVHVGPGLLAEAGRLCVEAGAVGRGLLVTNEAVGSLYGALVQRSLSLAGLRVPRKDVPDGEQYKTMETTGRILRAAVAHKLDRRSFFIALGGGIVGDVTVFAAATFLRGVDFVQVPTTLLAQVDAAVGGKVGVNLDEGKNLVGAFHQPRTVIADVDTLQSLPARELAAGMAEVIKYGMIADPDLLDFTEQRMGRLMTGDPTALMRVVARSCQVKAEFVAHDERETRGVREALNFGHTIGHALEAVGGYATLLHGEAVAIGMVAAALLSARLTGFPMEDVERLVTLLKQAGLPTAPPDVDAGQVLTIMRRDKKVLDDRTRFVLLERTGQFVVRDDVPDELVLETLQEQRHLWTATK